LEHVETGLGGGEDGPKMSTIRRKKRALPSFSHRGISLDDDGQVDYSYVVLVGELGVVQQASMSVTPAMLPALPIADAEGAV
jgi:hypothetical protein